MLENVRMLERLVKNRVTDIKNQEVLLGQLTAVCNYLKHGYYKHVDRDGDVVHNSRRGTVGIQIGSGTEGVDNVVVKDGEKGAHRNVDGIERNVEERSDEVLRDAENEYIDDAESLDEQVVTTTQKADNYEETTNGNLIVRRDENEDGLCDDRDMEEVGCIDGSEDYDKEIDEVNEDFSEKDECIQSNENVMTTQI